MNIGKAIKKTRKDSGYNQVDFSTKVGITQAFLSQLENNKKDPSISTLRKMAKICKIDLFTLLKKGKNVENI